MENMQHVCQLNNVPSLQNLQTYKFSPLSYILFLRNFQETYV